MNEGLTKRFGTKTACIIKEDRYTMLNRICYPFTAVVGQNDVREALLLNLIDPQIGGVLIDGERGSAKSTLARSVAPLFAGAFVEVPLCVSADRLCGSVDLERAIETGRLCAENGLLAAANGGILYIDGVDLLPDDITDVLIETLSSGICRVEGSGTLFEQNTSFTLIGATSGGESGVRPHLADYFGLYAQTEHTTDVSDSIEIAKRVAAFEACPTSFAADFEPEERKLCRAIGAAKKLLPYIALTESNLSSIVEICLSAGVAGHRADIVLARTACAVAALHGKTAVDADDIAEAAHFVLPHRQRNSAPEQEFSPPEAEDKDQSEQNDSNNTGENEKPTDAAQSSREEPSRADNSAESQKGASGGKTQNFRVGDEFDIICFGHDKDRKPRVGTGKRTLTKSARKSGRYLYATAVRRNDDLALDATIRAAAPCQPFREKHNVAIAIRPGDIREKVRQRRVSNLLVFVVDASGSMGVQSRMTETKGTILSLLRDAYVRRDKIALVTFSGNDARVVLPPTGSPERGYHFLRELETGGRTPLCAGIDKGLSVIQSELRKQADTLPLFILITDGHGNVSVDPSKKPLDEALEKCEKLQAIKQIDSMVIDIEKPGAMRFGFSANLARALGGKYYRLEQLKSGELLNIVETGRKKL